MEDWTKYEPRFRYMMLDRLRQDCNYYLTYGNRNPNCLWGGNEHEQIQTMKNIWNTFPSEDTPEWLTWDDILDLEKKMGVLKEWHSVEMTKDLAEKFKVYLYENKLKYEPSEAGQLVHFEVLMNNDESIAANKWIDDNL